MAEPPCPKVNASNHKICEEMEFTNVASIHTWKTYIGKSNVMLQQPRTVLREQNTFTPHFIRYTC